MIRKLVRFGGQQDQLAEPYEERLKIEAEPEAEAASGVAAGEPLSVWAVMPVEQADLFKYGAMATKRPFGQAIEASAERSVRSKDDVMIPAWWQKG